jgi:hypothetical protein
VETADEEGNSQREGGGWETRLDKEEEEEFRQLLRNLKELREIRFP